MAKYITTITATTVLTAAEGEVETCLRHMFTAEIVSTTILRLVRSNCLCRLLRSLGIHHRTLITNERQGTFLIIVGRSCTNTALLTICRREFFCFFDVRLAILKTVGCRNLHKYGISFPD